MKVGSATPSSTIGSSIELALPKALSVGDLDLATACFARDGCLITPDATAIHGRDRIRPVLAQLIAQHVDVVGEVSQVIDGGDVRLVREWWRLRAGAGPKRFVQVLHPTLVLRRIESEWKLAIAAPWGWAGWPL